MRRARARPTAALALVAALAGAAWTAPATAAQPLRLTDPASGRAVEIEPGARALHLVFFATWCPPCVAELGRLVELEARWHDRGYRLILVAVQTRHTSERLAKFIEERDPPGRLLFDADGAVERAWRAGQLPTHLILDATGKEVARGGGLDAGLEEALERLLGRRASGERGR